jgi:CRISPR-associated protein Cas2
MFFMPMLLIDLVEPKALLEGQISRKLLEIRSGVYVGSLSKRQMQTLWDAVLSSKPRAALLVYAAKTETGISMKSIGKHRYSLIDSDGLQLVSFQKEPMKNR